jgi:hypothetical protein
VDEADDKKRNAAKIGEAKLDKECAVGDKKVKSLFFGTTDMCKNTTIVDKIKTIKKGTATLFVKSGDEYVRVTTNVLKDDGSRAVGTILDPKGKAISEIKQGKAFYGEVTILEKPYITGYEPIFEKGTKNIIGIYYVGYLKLD